jgi:hypothetical protein
MDKDELIKKLERRIHNQRVALRNNWEIIEMRASYPNREEVRSRMLASALKWRNEAEKLKKLLAEVTQK